MSLRTIEPVSLRLPATTAANSPSLSRTPEPESDPDPEPEGEREDTGTLQGPNPSSASASTTWIQVQGSPTLTSTSSGAMLEGDEEAGDEAKYQGLFGSRSTLVYATDQYSVQVEMLERLLQLDLEQAIVWQSWDESRDEIENTPISFLLARLARRLGFSRWAMCCGHFAAGH